VGRRFGDSLGRLQLPALAAEEIEVVTGGGPDRVERNCRVGDVRETVAAREAERGDVDAFFGEAGVGADLRLHAAAGARDLGPSLVQVGDGDGDGLVAPQRQVHHLVETRRAEVAPPGAAGAFI